MYLRLLKALSKRSGIGLFGKLAFALALMFSYSSAHAIPTTFVYDPAGSSASFTSLSGLCIVGSCAPQAVTNPNPIVFTLDNVGDSEAFDFLDVILPGGIGVGTGQIAANLAFSAPSSASSGATATASGAILSVFGFTVGATGDVTWNSQPGNIIFSDGTEVALNFASGSGSCGPFSCGGGLTLGLAATTTLVTQAVPEPSLVALLGAGVFAFGVVNRRKKKRV